VKRTTK